MFFTRVVKFAVFKQGKGFALGLSFLLIVSGCGRRVTTFSAERQAVGIQNEGWTPASESNKSAEAYEKNVNNSANVPVDPVPTLIPVASFPQTSSTPDATVATSDTTAEKGKNIEKTRVLDSFSLTSDESTSEIFAVPTNPFQIDQLEQVLPTLKSSTVDVLSSYAAPKSIYIYSPVKIPTSYNVKWQEKSIDLFILIDDSESFASLSSLKIRTKNAIKKMIGNLAGSNWRLFMSGLPGNSVNDALMLDSAVVVDANIAIDSAVDSVLRASAMGDEQSFQGLANLVDKYKNQDRDNAVHAYFIISDAPNCKDNNNADSPSCNRALGYKDNYRYLFNNTNVMLPAYMSNMSLFGGYYRMTDNLAVCSNLDSVEVPNVGEILKLNSQYAEASFLFEKYLYPSTPAGNNPSWIGNICSVTENISFVDSFTDSIKDLAKYRFVLPSAFEAFADNPEYNFSIAKSDATIVPNSNFSTISNRLVILQDAGLSDLTIAATGNRQNSYRNKAFVNIFDVPARDGTVQISWTYLGVSGHINCKLSADFTGAASTSFCRHWDRSLYLKDYSNLPSLPPATVAVVLPLTVSYERDVPAISAFSVTATSDIILTNLVEFISTPSIAGSIVTTPNYSVNANKIDVAFGSSLPAGRYGFKYFEKAQQKFSASLSANAEISKQQPICFLPNQTASYNAAAAKIELNTGIATACTLRSDGKTLDLDILIPVDGSTLKRNFRVGYLSLVPSTTLFNLKAPPSAGTLIVRRFSVGDAVGIVLDTSKYSITNTLLTLKEALMPGEKVSIGYRYLPGLGDGCFILSSKAFAGTAYSVKFGLPNSEIDLSAAQYVVTSLSLHYSQLCIDKTLLDYNKRLVVSYISTIIETPIVP